MTFLPPKIPLTSSNIIRKVCSKDFFIFDIWKNASWKIGMEFFSFYPRTDKRGVEWGDEATPLKVFLSFLLEDKTSAPGDSW